MPPKRATKKKAAGGKATAKGSKAPAKKAAPRKPPARRAGGEGTRKQLSRRVKSGEASAAAAAAVQDDAEDDEDEPPRPPPNSRAVRKPATKRATRAKIPAEDSDNDDGPLPAKRPTTKTTKRPAGSDEEDEVEQPRAKRPKRGEAPIPEEQSDDQPGAQEAGEQQDELIDNAENYPDCPDIAENTQLARVETDNVDFTLRGENPTEVTLSFRLEVYPDPHHTQCRLFYRLRFWLTRTDEEEGAEAEAGYIHAYRIAKTTAAHRDAENRAWITELMPKNLKAVPQEIRETAICLRALFNLTGEPSATKVREPILRRSLTDNSLLFIEMIHVRQPYQRRGLLTPLLQHWLQLLQQLSEWFAFTGNIVLVPGKPDNEIGRRVWAEADMSDAQVEDILTRTYERQGWTVWVRAGKVGDSLVRVMGRELASIPEEGEEEDGGQNDGDGEGEGEEE